MLRILIEKNNLKQPLKLKSQRQTLKENSMSSLLLPYDLTQNGSCYDFVTISGRQYSISLLEQTSRMVPYCRHPILFYELALIRVDGKIKLITDNNISHTVADFITRLLQVKPESVIIANTDGSDGKHHCRERLFNRWVSEYCPDWIEPMSFGLDNGEHSTTAYVFFSSSHPYPETIQTGVLKYYQENYS